MYVCPHCQWPFASQNELNTHIDIKHSDELLDDGVYAGDNVVNAPYDDGVPEGYDWCLNCDGEGTVYHYGQYFPCGICDGTGFVPDDYEYDDCVDLS